MNNNKQDEGSNKGVSSTTVKSFGISVQDAPSSLKDKLNISGGVVVTSVDKLFGVIFKGFAARVQ